MAGGPPISHYAPFPAPAPGTSRSLSYSAELSLTRKPVALGAPELVKQLTSRTIVSVPPCVQAKFRPQKSEPGPDPVTWMSSGSIASCGKVTSDNVPGLRVFAPGPRMLLKLVEAGPPTGLFHRYPKYLGGTAPPYSERWYW